MTSRETGCISKENRSGARTIFAPAAGRSGSQAHALALALAGRAGATCWARRVLVVRAFRRIADYCLAPSL